MHDSQALLRAEPAVVAEALRGRGARVLLFGAMGTGKSTLAAGLARCAGPNARVISADPGSPAFGVPGAVNLGRWCGARWDCLVTEPLCSLDAARFRLPLVQAVARLAARVRGVTLIVDAPGVVRGVAGAELLQGLAGAADVDVVVLLENDELAGLSGDVAALGRRVVRVRPATAGRPARSQRERQRTALWDAHLATANTHELMMDRLQVTGTPPPATSPEVWHGRQVALLQGNVPVAMGEIVAFDGRNLVLTLAADPGNATSLLIRDASRTARGMLATAPSLGPGPPRRGRAETRPVHEPVALMVGGVDVRLLNGVLGDPLVHLRVPNRAGGVLFDLGDAAAMPVKALHGVSDVFVSHGHIDHIGGFPTLLRARLGGEPPPCRIYGPPGLHAQIGGFVAGVHWDRIGDSGPVFLVAEADGDRLRWRRIQPGRPAQDLANEPLEAGVLLRTEAFTVRCATLDHGIPVLAFALELPDQLQVREAALVHHGLSPGPWLGELKRRFAAGQSNALISLPDGQQQPVGRLGGSLLDIAPGTRIAYATDLADSHANRQSLCNLARDADLLICEASFLSVDAEQARATGHLTAPACVQIARLADAQRLLPFHFSRRYSHRMTEVIDELLNARQQSGFAGELVPPG